MSQYKDAIKKYKDGALLDIFVKTKSKKVVFPTGYNTWRKRIEIDICAEPKDNKANKEIIQTVANFLGKPIRDVLIISGEKNRGKTLYIKRISINEIIDKIGKSI